MSEMSAHDRLIDSLADRLEPVRPLFSPGLRAFGWIAAVALAGAAMLPFIDRASLVSRFGVMDLCVTYLGAALTATTAAVAAFQTSVPGRDARWAWLPLPALALWVGAGGFGCLRGWTLPGAEPTTLSDVGGCFRFILLLSIPLSLGFILMLRRACPLRPTLTAALGGLAAAAGAASLLVLFHPHDATALDLLVHVVVVALVVGLNRIAGRRLFI